MRKNKFCRPTRAGKGDNNRHGERRVCGNRRRIHYSAVIRRFFYAGAEMCIAGAEIIAYGIFAMTMMISAAIAAKKARSEFKGPMPPPER
jgi:hypothetical protein